MGPVVTGAEVVPITPARVGWHSKASPGPAHYLGDDGEPCCSHLRLHDGRPDLAPFKTAWLPFRVTDHLCGKCRKRHPRVCQCGRCGVRAARPSPNEQIDALAKTRGAGPRLFSRAAPARRAER
jgi:hypothetical protein